MGNSKSKTLKNNDNLKRNKEINEKINNFFSETALLISEEDSKSKTNPYNYLIPTIEKSDLGNITDSHAIIELSLDLISKHCHIETYKKANLILYTSLLYPPLFETDDKIFQINSGKSSNYIHAQRAFDKIKDMLWINEDGDYVQKEKQLRYRNSIVSKGSSNQQNLHNNQSFLSIFNNNNLNASGASYKDYNTDYEKASVRNYKRNPSMKSNIYDEQSRKKSLKSLRTMLIAELPKKLSLNKIKEIHTEKNSIESENELIRELSPHVEITKKEENKKPQGGNKIRRIDYGYELQKNLLKKIRNVNIHENYQSDTRSKELNNKELNNYGRERNLQIHKKLDKANYSWLKKILNLSNKNKTSKKKQVDFKINMKEIVKQTVKEEPEEKFKENGKRSTGIIFKENLFQLKNVSDTNLFKQYVDKYLGIEKIAPAIDRKQCSYTIKSSNRQMNSPKLNHDNLKEQVPNKIALNSEIKNRDTEEFNSEYETPDEDNSYAQINRIKMNYASNYNESGNSSYDSEYYHEYMNTNENGIEASLEGVNFKNYYT